MACVAAPSRAADPGSETLYLDVQSSTRVPQVRTSAPLETGRHYVVRISGTISIWPPAGWNAGLRCGTAEPFPMTPSPGRPNGEVGVDPETVFAVATPPEGTTCAELGLPRSYRSVYSGGLYADTGSGLARLQPYDGLHTAPTPDHSYAYDVYGQGVPLQIRFIAKRSRDDYGVFTVDITPDQESGPRSTPTPAPTSTPDPDPEPVIVPGALNCRRHRVVIRVRDRRHARLVRGTVLYAGRHRTMHRRSRGLVARLDVRRLRRRRLMVTVVARSSRGRVIKIRRRIRLCGG